MKPTKDWGKWLFPPRSGYIRYICAGEARLEVPGEKISDTVEMTNELMFLSNRDQANGGHSGIRAAINN